MYKLCLAVLLILITAIGFERIWHYVRQPQITMYVYSDEKWNTNLFKGKSLNIYVQHDPVCTFRLSKLIHLVAESFELDTFSQEPSKLGILFITNCGMTTSFFYKVKVAISVWIAFCNPETGRTCDSKVLEIDRPIGEKDWDRIVPLIFKELHLEGESHRRVRVR